MPDPDLRVRFYFTFQVNQIWSGLIPFYPVGLQLRVTTFLTPSFTFKREEGGKWFWQGFHEWMDLASNKICQNRCPTSSMWGFDYLHPLQFSTLHSERCTADIKQWGLRISHRIQFRIFCPSFNYRCFEGDGYWILTFFELNSLKLSTIINQLSLYEF